MYVPRREKWGTAAQEVLYVQKVVGDEAANSTTSP